MKPIIAVCTGDPYGIGPEICLKAAASPRVLAVCRPLLIGDRQHLLNLARVLPGGVGSDPGSWPEVTRSGFAEWGTKQGDDIGLEEWNDGPAVNDMADLGGDSQRGPSAAGGRAALKYVKQAVGLVRFKAVSAVVTAPLSKSAMRLAGQSYPGHTELLADLVGASPDEVAMLFVTSDFKVSLMTTHAPLAEAIASLSQAAIVKKLVLLRTEHQRWFGTDPRIGLSALNPHGGEDGMFGAEEESILTPAVEEARRAGIKVTGPFPADTLFVRASRGEFDVVLSLYHDQATIAVKTRSFGSAVNMTLGLPFLRTSVDHGTAYDIAGRGVADPGSLVEAIALAARLAPRAGAPAG